MWSLRACFLAVGILIYNDFTAHFLAYLTLDNRLTTEPCDDGSWSAIHWPFAILYIKYICPHFSYNGFWSLYWGIAALLWTSLTIVCWDMEYES